LAQGKHRAKPSKRRTLALVGIPLVVVALAVGAYVVFVADGDGTGGLLGGDPSEGPAGPPFAFRVNDARAVSTTRPLARGLQSATKRAATGAARTLSGLYRSAFLDPTAWAEGNYARVWRYFHPGAQAAAMKSVDELTAGADAGEAYTRILPAKGKLDVVVLFDQRDRAIAYEADALFAASAERPDGAVTKLVSAGTFFLQPTGRGWRVTSFDVRRDDHRVEGTSATPAAGPTA
jgi:hypothetical protein